MNNQFMFYNWLEELKEKYDDKPAITCENTLSYRQLYDLSCRFASVLIDNGVKKGDKVILWAFNSLDWIVAFFGIIMAGGVASLVNYSLNSSEVTTLTKLSEAKWALLGDNRIFIHNPLEAKQALADGCVQDDHIFSLSELFIQALDDSCPYDFERLHLLSNQIQPNETQCIIFTTGTTQMPKGVQLSSGSLLGNAKARSDFHSEDLMSSCCVALPLFHSFGLMGVLYRLNKGVHIYLVSKIKPEIVMELIAKNRIETLTTVGAICGAMSELPDFEEKLKGVLKICVLGGGFTSPAVISQIENKLGGKILMGYGQSESSSVISCNISMDPLEKRLATVGYVLPNIKVRFYNEGKGEAQQGMIGELLVKGPGVMNGYLGMPKEQQPIDSDGWLHTGDLARLTEDGMLKLEGRIKDIIVRKGENISPLEIERVMLEEPSIREVKVFGVPHPTWGESVEACVIFDGEAAEEEELRNSLGMRIAHYKIPSHFFSYTDFPLLPNGKLNQRKLKESLFEKMKELTEKQLEK